MKHIILAVVLAILASPAVAQSSSTGEDQKRQTYSDANRDAIGCQNDAWTITKDYQVGFAARADARRNHSAERKVEVTIPTGDELLPLVNSFGECELKIQTKELDDRMKGFVALRDWTQGDEKEKALCIQRYATLCGKGDMDAAKHFFDESTLLSDILYDVSETENEMRYKFIEREDASVLKDYLALVDKYNGLVTSVRQMPRTTPVPFAIPRELHCQSFNAGSITTTSCE